jgi:two-component system chemotaxis sensor kinase CheA
MDLVNQIFRALHTIKGSGSMFGFEEIAAFTHEVETVFDMVRNGDVQATPVLCSLALRSRDQIRAMLDAEDDEPVSPEGMQDILDGLRAFVEGTNEAAGTDAVQVGSDEEPVVDLDMEAELDPEPEAELATEPEAEPEPAPASDLHQYAITLRPLGGHIDADAVEAFFEELERLGTLRIESGHRDTGQGWELSLATEAAKENVQDCSSSWTRTSRSRSRKRALQPSPHRPRKSPRRQRPRPPRRPPRRVDRPRRCPALRTTTRPCASP